MPGPDKRSEGSMYYIAQTTKSVAEAARDLEAAVQKHKFGVLHVHDLKDTLTRKGFPLGPQCRVFEVCNPQHAARVLARDMRLNMALPCRISVFEDRGVTTIGTILPSEMLRQLSPDPELAEVAATVEATIKAIIDDAAAPADARRALLLLRETLAREIVTGAAARRGERDANVPDSAELAAADVAHDLKLAEVDRDAAELAAVDAALARLDTGSYGRCADCGVTIDAARLAHTPQAACCLPCQQRREARSGQRIARL
jgi:RNA polymerase-binding protein DksA